MSSPDSVMVVDDELELANLYNEFLQRSGFKSTCFIDPPLLALEHYNQNPNRYSLVITDLCMPSLDGISLVKRMREVNINIKILLITAFYFNELPDTPEYRKPNLLD